MVVSGCYTWSGHFGTYFIEILFYQFRDTALKFRPEFCSSFTFVILQDYVLRNTELEDLFSTAPESPWDEAPCKDAVERTPLGGLSLSLGSFQRWVHQLFVAIHYVEFVLQWALMALLDPVQSLANLIYIGYNCNAASALNITRRRSIDRRKQQTECSVFQCFVFGPKKAGKSALLMSLLDRWIQFSSLPLTDSIYGGWVHENVKYGLNSLTFKLCDLCYDAFDAIIYLFLKQGNKKTHAFPEIPEDGVKKLLPNKESLADCNVVIFVYDSSLGLETERVKFGRKAIDVKGNDTGKSTR
ncbi:unnamed protein product [Fraxinus pennsylvanica]|uniref:Mitochondrial Rho GTPase 1/3 EF hand associated type-1 domain-containing protein n=1 Tax=Fraxinus pennsylvanica TaxID=56036 RepID=A0AAD2EF92_9LAMI|nr:unnamed protein product [Fraxinus pennsylvanica]